ncbi:hypothetical protein BDQ94DRAFT_70994 [Aspergillus welwitschiae]|uniref:Uncharacterized protein n=1 Tax=Aspergillus welwitschiae TaxID=1341132 RepID=A0A3F3QF60_9EURO|nr:hypothetical protein BDQ94DRAFT_70994 [Aspergillus welwitschiae]RDH37893.1 hypothetical protein BDQ94DRAFT_70994 [Aspergillus welwitschiae]
MEKRIVDPFDRNTPRGVEVIIEGKAMLFIERYGRNHPTCDNPLHTPSLTTTILSPPSNTHYTTPECRPRHSNLLYPQMLLKCIQTTLPTRSLRHYRPQWRSKRDNADKQTH